MKNRENRQRKVLSKEERFEKDIDAVYKKIWNDKEEEKWKIENNKVLILTTIAENKLKNSIYLRVKHTAKEFLLIL